MSVPGSISVAEREKYRDIFLHLNTKDGLLSGVEAKSVLLKSGLSNQQLEQIWNLSDLGLDGQLNCEEFIIAMHLTYNALNEIPIPNTLPSYLLPAGYAPIRSFSEGHLDSQHLSSAAGVPGIPTNFMTASRGLTDSSKSIEFTDKFDWYLAPSQRLKYENIFHEAPIKNGLLSKEHALEIFLSNSRPKEEFKILWNLIDVFQRDAIDFKQFALFHHIINARKSGKPFPTALPPELILTFKSSATSQAGLSNSPDRITSPASSARRQSAFATDSAEHREMVELEETLAKLELQWSAINANPTKRENVTAEVHSMIKFLSTVLDDLPEQNLDELIDTLQKEIKQTELLIQHEKSTTI